MLFKLQFNLQITVYLASFAEGLVSILCEILSMKPTNHSKVSKFWKHDLLTTFQKVMQLDAPMQKSAHLIAYGSS